MAKAVMGLVATVFMAGIFINAHAQSLPKSGSISFHTGWRNVADVIEVADKRWQGQGRILGVTFNDQGSGPLHLGPANCSSTFVVNEGNGLVKGYCTFSDADGDRVFTDFSGTIGPNGSEGTNTISGGTGKYAGVTGSGPWKCMDAGKSGELHCAQRLDYKLP